MTPKLSIVIPTRERSDTLLHTLRTIVNQDYQDCEIIVSDNASKDNTRKVVESFSDSRIRYINTGKRVNMSDNWEFGLKHAKGDFVTYLGDDDGFIPGAITKAMALIEKFRLNAFIWNPIQYCWPDHIEESLRNWIFLRFENDIPRMVDGRKMLKEVIKFRDSPARLPSIINGIIKKEPIDKIIKLSTNGVFFNSFAPDVFSGMALSMVVGKYLLTSSSFAVNGASRHSNGTSAIRQGLNQKDTPAAKFLSENPREYDYRIKLAPTSTMSVIGEYLFAKQFIPELHLPEPNWNYYVRSLIREAGHAFHPDEILQSAAHTAKLTGLAIKIPDRVLSVKPAMSLGMRAGWFSFKVPIGMVNNVYDACQLVAGMLPSTIENDDVSPFSTFVREITDCFISETKTLTKKYLLKRFLRHSKVK